MSPDRGVSGNMVSPGAWKPPTLSLGSQGGWGISGRSPQLRWQLGPAWAFAGGEGLHAPCIVLPKPVRTRGGMGANQVPA